MQDFTTLPAPLAALVAAYEKRFPTQEAPAIPFFSFDDAGIRSRVASFAYDWGDAQATEGYHAGVLVDVADLDAQGEIEAGLVLARGEARTDDASAFIRTFAGAWADGYAARVVFALKRGY